MLPAASWILGAWVARHLSLSSNQLTLLLAVGLLGACLRSPRRWLFVAVACCAAAALHADARRELDPSVFRPTGPVTVEARVASHPRGRPGEAWTWLRVRWMEQRNPGGVRRLEGPMDLLLQLPRGAEAPPWGSRLRVKSHLRRSTARDNRVPVRPGPWRLRLASERFLDVVEPPGLVHGLASSLRRAVEARLGTDAHPAHALRRALLLGSADHLPERWERSLRAAGLSHLLAVSGLHVGLVAGLAWWLGMALFLRGSRHRRLRLLLVLAAVGLFLALVGPRPSALRAGAMAGLLVAALLLERPPAALNALAVCAGALAVLDPAVVDDLGYQLSVGATGAILVLAPRWSRHWTLLPPGLRTPLAVTVAAQCATLPFLLPWTGLVHPAAPLWNLVAIPWLAIFLASSFVSLALPASVALLEALALPVAVLADLPAGFWLAWLLHLGPAGAAALATVTACWMTWPRRGTVVVAPVLVLGLHCGPAMQPPGPEARVELIQLDVGQGDALLLRGGGRTVLVDGGGWRRGDSAGRLLVPALARLGVRRIDVAVLSHPDADHCAGLAGLTSYVEVREVWSSPGWHGACAHELLGRRGTVWRPLWAGVERSAGPWSLRTLWPPPGTRSRDAENDGSLVLVAEAGPRRVLLTGDVEAWAERRLLRRGREELRARLLKVAHHGSKSSSGAAFLPAVFEDRSSPRLALVGVGRRNPFGHPHPDVLARLERHDALVHRTDLGGLLHLSWPAAESPPMPPMPCCGKEGDD